jgi:hypothetical protein
VGAWGFNILQDDTPADVYGDYVESVNAGLTHAEILKRLTQQYREVLQDKDEAPLFWLAVARAQWDYGALEAGVLARIEGIVARGGDWSRWAEAGPKSVQRRRRALDQFLAKLRMPNPKPRRPRKGILRSPVFRAGDCIAIRLSDGEYGAAIVTACPPEESRPGADTYGINVVAQLRYKSPEKPTPEVFERREWLRVNHHGWRDEPNVVNVMSLRFRGVRGQFEVVGSTRIRAEDPKTSRTYAGWDFAEQMVFQARWEAGDRT